MNAQCVLNEASMLMKPPTFLTVFYETDNVGGHFTTKATAIVGKSEDSPVMLAVNSAKRKSKSSAKEDGARRLLFKLTETRVSAAPTWSPDDDLLPALSKLARPNTPAAVTAAARQLSLAVVDCTAVLEVLPLLKIANPAAFELVAAGCLKYPPHVNSQNLHDE